jgi:ATP-binding protein involved in chromosome partitioning
MRVEQAAVLDALKVVQDPDLHRDIVSLGFIKDLKVDGGHVAFTIELTTPACPVKDQMRDQARAAVLRMPGVSAVDVRMSAQVREAVSGDGQRQGVPGVKNVIAVGAGKGGVGKTTVAVNLAIALARAGGKVGLIDADIYGPNVPIMLGMKAELTTDGQKIVPAEKYGLQVISITSWSICRPARGTSRSVSARQYPSPAPSSSPHRSRCRWRTAAARWRCTGS